MKSQIIKAMQHNYMVDIMYISKDGRITKRRVKVLKLINDKFQAYCFTRQSKRTFMIDNLLAIAPVVKKEHEVI
ncbi:transcriptional regulator [Metasolibacillus meyeri]|uniref:Transcriptional regulator n=1 Tax=Metasolibacillus meyeri TaxID=1071052 RepID=A0AAW9NXE5_9BACL|nr:transcriptional regulator [Metasolibacillus meyeri]MEC1180369.1 transcriptional regulator [Metasolibacillus meyeri]